MDGSSISQCLSPPCPDQIDGREDHVPFAHKAVALRCSLISKRCDGESDQWVYFGNEWGIVSASHQDRVDITAAWILNVRDVSTVIPTFSF